RQHGVRRCNFAASITMMAFLAPIPRGAFLNGGAPFAGTVRPTSVEPVNETTRIRSADVRVEPTASPPPVTRLTTPRGTPASSRSLTKLSAESGVSVAGFYNTGGPHTNGGRIVHSGDSTGRVPRAVS